MVLSKLKEEQTKLRKEVRERTIGYILAALGFVAGLAWNEAIKSAIDQFLPSLGSGVLVKFLYAALVTVFIVFISVYLIRFTNKPEEKKEI